MVMNAAGVQLWDLANEAPLPSSPLVVSPATFTHAALSLDGTHVGATIQGTDRNISIQIWNLTDGTTIVHPLGGPDTFVDVSFTNDGAYFGTLDALGGSASYRVSDGATVANLTPEGGVTTLTGGALGGLAPAGPDLFISVNGSANVLVWNVATAQTLGTYRLVLGGSPSAIRDQRQRVRRRRRRRHDDVGAVRPVVVRFARGTRRADRRRVALRRQRRPHLVARGRKRVHGLGHADGARRQHVHRRACRTTQCRSSARSTTPPAGSRSDMPTARSRCAMRAGARSRSRSRARRRHRAGVVRGRRARRQHLSDERSRRAGRRRAERSGAPSLACAAHRRISVFATAGASVAVGLDDGRLIVWDTVREPPPPRARPRRDPLLWRIAFSESGKRLVVGDGGGRIHVVDRTGTQLRQVRDPITTDHGPVLQLGFSGDDRVVAVSPILVSYVDIATGNTLAANVAPTQWSSLVTVPDGFITVDAAGAFDALAARSGVPAAQAVPGTEDGGLLARAAELPRRRQRVDDVPGGVLMFDVFISYSHEDEALASALASGLGRIGKPWWRRRSLRVFRDASVMAASADLWDSIRGPLEESSRGSWR